MVRIGLVDGPIIYPKKNVFSKGGLWRNDCGTLFEHWLKV